MVHEGKCFVTKFGSIHSTEKQAKEVEIKEEADDFAETISNTIAQISWGAWYDFGKDVYYHRKAIQEVIKNYNFIDPKQKDREV